MNQVNFKNTTLPSRMSSDDILKFLEAVKSKPSEESAIKAIYNQDNFEQTKNTLELLKLINSKYELTPKGSNLVNLLSEENEESFQDIFLDIILGYEPYSLLLQSIAHSSNQDNSTREHIVDYWEKHEYGSSSSNRQEGVKTFGELIKLAGLGDYKLGRHGSKTRIDWEASAQERIKNPLKFDNVFSDRNGDVNINLDNEQDLEILPESAVSTDISSLSQIEDKHQQTYAEKTASQIVKSDNSKGEKALIFHSNTNIQVSVDMSNWDSAQITAFFKAAYGQFNDNESFSPEIQTSISSSIDEVSDGNSES